MSGWICSYRKIWQHPIFEGNAERVGVWHWMLHTAAWKDQKFNVGGKLIDIKRGQLCVSQRQVEAETGMGRQAFRTFLKALEANQTITHKVTGTATHKRTIITICNYKNYQAKEDGGNPKSNPPATHQQPNNEQGNNKTILPSEEAAASEPIEISVVTSALWQAGVQYLTSRGIAESSARSFIGRCRKSHPDSQILAAVEAAQKSGTRDPIPYITETLKGGHNVKPSKQRERVNAFISGARGAS